MSDVPFHLGYFVGIARPPAWNQQWAGDTATGWLKPDWYVSMVQSLERAKFDLVMFADSSALGDVYGGTAELSLKNVGGPGATSLDPIALMPMLLQQTARLGITATAATTEWPPYLLARNLATLDHLSSGRVGWNMVTGGNESAARNYGAAAAPHDVRYDMADEYLELTTQLWNSWEPDAVVLDADTGYYADHTKVHTVDYHGRFYSSRGPLTMPRSPQGKPVLFQAGASGRGREFAARWSDVVLGTGASAEAMKNYREDVRTRMATYGRKPDDCKVLFLCWPILADTDAEAEERFRQFRAKKQALFEITVANMSFSFSIDLSQFDPDVPLSEEVTTEAHQGALANLIKSGKSLRELFSTPGFVHHFVGTPETVAGQMRETMQEAGGDGFMIGPSHWMTRRYISEVCDGLVPVLQHYGLTRTEYEHLTLIDNLRSF